MQPIPPYPDVPGDSPMRILAASSGQLRAVSKSRAVWVFGAMIGSPLADGLKWHSEAFLFVLATHSGRILATHYGFSGAAWVENGVEKAPPLPKRFRAISDAKL